MERSVVLPDFRLSRRDFLKLAAWAGTFAFPITAAYLGYKSGLIKTYLQYKSHSETFNFTRGFRESAIEHSEFDNIPDKLRGFYINMSYVYLGPEQNWDYYIDQARELQAVRARVMIGDAFQNNAFKIFFDNENSYNERVLDRLAKFAESLNRGKRNEDEQIGLEIDFFDPYFLGNGKFVQNPVYGQVEVTSPYNAAKDKKGYREFFTSEHKKQAFKARMKKIVGGLRGRGIKNIDCWSVLNEANPEIIGADGVDVLTEWYKEIVDYLRIDLQVEEPIVTGLKYPWHIRYGEVKGLTANTIHLYLPEIDTALLENYLQQSKDPLIVQEFGIPYTLFGLPIPQWLYHHALWLMTRDILRVALRFEKIDGMNRVISRISSFAGWELGMNEDSYSLENRYRPQEVTDLILTMSKLRSGKITVQ